MRHVSWLLALILLLSSVAGIALAQAPNELLGPPLDSPVPPMRIIARYFDFTPEQVEQIKGFIETRKAAVEPLVKQITEKEQALHNLLGAPGPDPVAVGNLVLAIRQLRGQVRDAQEQFDTDLEGILTPDQLTKLRAARRADRLEPVVRAMRELKLGLP